MQNVCCLYKIRTAKPNISNTLIPTGAFLWHLPNVQHACIHRESTITRSHRSSERSEKKTMDEDDDILIANTEEAQKEYEQRVLNELIKEIRDKLRKYM